MDTEELEEPEEAHEDEDEEEGSEEIKKSNKKAKLNSGKAASANKPTVYKKGKWNPNVEIVEECHQLESESVVPNFECSTRNSNREVIRAAKIGSKKLLEKIVKSDHKISRLTERWGVDNRDTALKTIIDNGNKDMLILYLEYLTDEKKTIKFGKDNVVYLKNVDTGFNDRYAYGVATRKVALSRGGRQGNNALVEDEGNPPAGFDNEHIEYLLSSKKTTTDTLKTILSYYPNIENQLINKIGTALRFGNRDLAAYLMERANKNGGYGMSEFFLPALTGKSERAVAEIKKPNCTKKAFGMGNFTPIHCACLNPNVAVLKHILTVNPEYLNMDDSMRKPVHYAACCDSAAPLTFLAEQNADTREMDNMRTTALMYACRAGSVECVKFLLEDRSVPAFKDRLGYSAIHYAAEYGHIKIVEMLLNKGVKIALAGPDRKTALHIAAAKGDFEMVKFLVEKGAKVVVKDKCKRTPLILACKNGNLKVASFLLQQGSPYDDGDSSGNTPLHYACAYGYPEMIDLLFKAGANPNSVNSWNLSPTAVALLKSYFSCLRKMLDNPATNVNCVDDEGRTLVSNSIKTINAENFAHVAYLLRDKKADPNIPDSKGLTAFDYLCSHNIDTLASADIKADMTLDEINTIKADKKSLYKKYFKLFIDCNADINHKDTNGQTPIFEALKAGNIEAVKGILDQPRVDVAVVNNEEQTIFHFLEYIVCEEDFFAVTEKLFSKSGRFTGELLNKYAKNGQTAVHVVLRKFANLIDGLRGNIYTKLETELKLAKKPKAPETPVLNTAGGLFGGARTKMTARRNYGYNAFKRPAQFGSADTSGVVLTQDEIKRLTEEAQNKTKDRIKEFLEFLKLSKNSGADFDLLLKKPIVAKKVPQEGEEEEEDNDAAYDLLSYFDFYRQRLARAVESKIDLPEKEQVPENVGYGLLHITAGCQCSELYKFLIEEARIKTNVSSVHGESELLRFIQSIPNGEEQAKILEYLLSKGLNIESFNLKKVTPLLLAVRGNKAEFVKTLIKYRANINAQDIDGKYPLLQAVLNKNLPLVEVLLANKANPNLVDVNQRNCIHWAINLSNADADASNEIENCLLSSGGNLNAVDIRGRTPLHYAFVKIGDPFNISPIDPIETVSNIISRKGVQIDVRDQWGNTPLNYAAQRGSVISALYLMKNNANIDNVNLEGNTPLNECLLHGHQNMSIFLIQKNANLNIEIKVKTAEQKKQELEKKHEEEKKAKLNPDSSKMMDMESLGNKDDVEVSSDESKSNDSSDDEENNEAEDDDANTTTANNPFGNPVFGGFGAKMPAKRAFGGQFGMQAQQPQAGSAPDNLKFGKDEKVCSTFSVAIRRNWQSVAFLMLEFGFDLSLAILDCFNFKKYNYVYTLLLKKAEAGVYQTTNKEGQNLTHLFAKNASKISVDLFDKILGKLELKNLDFTSLDNNGRNSFHYACEAGSMKLVEMLLPKGVDPNLTDKQGMTPLGITAKDSFGQTVKFAELTRESGLDINKRFRVGKKEHTILTYIICENKSFDTFTKLHEMGADINLGDSDGWTPLVYYIRQNKLTEIQSLLKEFKVNTNIVDKQGRTIIHHVVKSLDYGSYENTEMLEFLAKHADINKPDASGNTPLVYAKQQQSGRLTQVLTKLKAKDLSMGEGIKRAVTSALNELDFPQRTYDFEADFEKFLDSCKKDSEQKRAKFNERIPVDKNAVGNYEVCYDGEDPFDCYMVKVEINYGYYSGNTFYKMQILREKVRDVYVLFTKWGRVGTDGQFQQTPFSNLDDAKKEFCSVFKSKSGNLWEDRHKFIKSSRKYRLVPFVAKTKFENYIKAFNYHDPKIPKSHLPKEIYQFMRRVCNYKIITNALKANYQFNSSEVPIHALTKERISDAKAVLDALSKTLQSYENSRKARELNQIHDYAEELTKLTSEFYELIPTTQYRDQAIPPVTSSWQLSNMQKLIKDLFYFEIVIKLVGAATLNMYRINPIDYCFNCLSFKIMPLANDTEEFKLLK
jgi:ankyrin repeat protein/predicted DNA-binding WGR domain protein